MSIEEKFNKCGFTRINNGLRDKIRQDDLSKHEFKVLWEIISLIHGYLNSKKYTNRYIIKNNTALWNRDVNYAINSLELKGYIKTVKTGRIIKIFTLQSYFCDLKNCYNCNPYNPKQRVCTKR